MNKTSLGLSENVEAALSYFLGWASGILFLIIERDNEFVKFHAMQSTLTFLGLTLLSIILFPLHFAGALLVSIIQIISIIVWIVCMVKAYKGEKFKLPIVGDLAEKYTTK